MLSCVGFVGLGVEGGGGEVEVDSAGRAQAEIAKEFILLLLRGRL